VEVKAYKKCLKSDEKSWDSDLSNKFVSWAYQPVSKAHNYSPSSGPRLAPT
jgi:hypothetical protein